ncbi:MAG TPA: RNase adapter RapZ [Candidatus Saccharicenans sp.]|nr:RNase adapter RapZ [Candidatus Saccharicenans sp.]HQO76102.1 RNase adapter RapZ [Candidatus Saccharicenans sp.]HUM79336.1 RNase adapter RapZ [Candidatus Saccharicenans sp.]
MGKDRGNGDFIIITGLSGSGKTVVSRFLEDLGYYCVDNLPAKLIPGLVDLWQKGKVEIARMALVIDIREPNFLNDFPRILKQLRVKPRLIFLEAADEALVKRFSESRRPHPLAKKGSILDGVRLERKKLAPIKAMADEVIDTTGLSISQLKDLVAGQILEEKKQHLQINIISFGYKYGLPLDSDLVFDTRFLPNPFYVDKLRNLNGKSKKVREFVLKSPETIEYLHHLQDFIDNQLPGFQKEGKSTLTISIGCTGGKHRSVVIAEALRNHLRQKKLEVKIIHRDIYK